MNFNYFYERSQYILDVLVEFVRSVFDFMFTATVIPLPESLGGSIELYPFDFFFGFFITLLFVRVILALNS